MCDIMSKLYKTYKYNLNVAPPTVLAKRAPLFKSQLNKYLSESLKKSIQKIEDRHKNPDHKIKLIVAKALNEHNDNENYNNNIAAIKILVGATTISFSLYLVYSFMKSYRR
jgi:hypothetical protein